MSINPRSGIILAALFSVVALPAAAQTPGPPQGLVFNLNSDATVTLQWSPPFTGGPPAAYVVQIGTATGATDILNQEIALVATYRTAVLAPGTYFAPRSSSSWTCRAAPTSSASGRRAAARWGRRRMRSSSSCRRGLHSSVAS